MSRSDPFSSKDVLNKSFWENIHIGRVVAWYGVQAARCVGVAWAARGRVRHGVCGVGRRARLRRLACGLGAAHRSCVQRGCCRRGTCASAYHFPWSRNHAMRRSRQSCLVRRNGSAWCSAPLSCSSFATRATRERAEWVAAAARRRVAGWR